MLKKKKKKPSWKNLSYTYLFKDKLQFIFQLNSCTGPIKLLLGLNSLIILKFNTVN